jgi:hypothetical protein
MSKRKRIILTEQKDTCLVCSDKFMNTNQKRPEICNVCTAVCMSCAKDISIQYTNVEKKSEDKQEDKREDKENNRVA